MWCSGTWKWKFRWSSWWSRSTKGNYFYRDIILLLIQLLNTLIRYQSSFSLKSASKTFLVIFDADLDTAYNIRYKGIYTVWTVWIRDFTRNLGSSRRIECWEGGTWNSSSWIAIWAWQGVWGKSKDFEKIQKNDEEKEEAWTCSWNHCFWLWLK